MIIKESKELYKNFEDSLKVYNFLKSKYGEIDFNTWNNMLNISYNKDIKTYEFSPLGKIILRSAEKALTDKNK